MAEAKAKGTWGARTPRTANELSEICKAFFEALVVPPEWKFLNWSNVFDASIISPANPDGTWISIGKTYRDTRTSGINLKEYRVCFLTFSERGGVVEKSIIDYGKFKRHCMVSNKTVEKLNVWIEEHFTSPSTTLTSTSLSDQSDQVDQVIDENDGLQHFRDRFK